MLDFVVFDIDIQWACTSADCYGLCFFRNVDFHNIMFTAVDRDCSDDLVNLFGSLFVMHWSYANINSFSFDMFRFAAFVILSV